MKKTFVLAALSATAAMAHAETLHVKIPFEFSATGTKMPAGEYSISEVPGTSPVLLLEGAGSKTLVFGRVTPENLGSGRKAAKAPALVFEKESLVGVRAAGRSFELSAPAK